MRQISGLIRVVLVFSCFTWSCGGGSSSTSPTDGSSGDTSADGSSGDASTDATVKPDQQNEIQGDLSLDVAPDAQVPHGDAVVQPPQDTQAQQQMGTACETDEDCPNGICVEGPDGKTCTTDCAAGCPEGWSCKTEGELEV